MHPAREFWTETVLCSPAKTPKSASWKPTGPKTSKLPYIIRATLGKVPDPFYSTSERWFRTRLERTAQGGTEIYITHRGMEEAHTEEDNTVWQGHALPILSWKPSFCAASWSSWA